MLLGIAVILIGLALSSPNFFAWCGAGFSAILTLAFFGRVGDKPQSAQKAGCFRSPPRSGIFSFSGKLSRRLTISRFGCMHILNNIYRLIRLLSFSRCPGFLSEYSICPAEGNKPVFFSAVYNFIMGSKI
ncbi:MAG: hypothetical protein DBX49_07875 [Clostridia bacterium]|nr:MAG: hypothetical protein DBX49_07875 [Clostridia bacterium]